MVLAVTLVGLEVDLAGEDEGLMEPFFRCERNGRVLGSAVPRLVNGRLQLRKLVLPRCGSEPFTLQMWAADDYEEEPRLLGVAELVPPCRPDCVERVEGTTLLLFLEDTPVPEHTRFTCSCELTTMAVGAIRDEEVVEEALLPVITTDPPPPVPPPELKSAQSSRFSMARSAQANAAKDMDDDPPPSTEDGKGPALYFVSGNRYVGELAGSTMSGNGTFEWREKRVTYEGTFKANTLSGAGKYTWSDGSTYVGEVLDGLRHGVGTFTAPGGLPAYEGEWSHGMRHGRGVLAYEDGAKYDGEWFHDERHGEGVMTYANGNVYDGSWVMGTKEGHGTMRWHDVSEQYTGDWRAGKQHGHGEHSWLRPQTEALPFQMQERYTGGWAHGQRHGIGVFFYANGSRYEGSWEYNHKSGQGLFTFEDGSTYEGWFHEDRMTENRVQAQPDLYGHLDLDVVMGPLEPERQLAVQAVHHTLTRHNTELKQIYRYYAAYNCPGTEAFVLSLGQFWQFLRDTRLLSPSLPLAQIDRIVFSIVSMPVADDAPFTQPSVHSDEISKLLTLQELIAGAKSVERHPPPYDPHKAERPILLREFVQTLVCLAPMVHPPPLQPLQPGQLVFPQQLRALLQEEVLPRACRRQPPAKGEVRHSKYAPPPCEMDDELPAAKEEAEEPAALLSSSTRLKLRFAYAAYVRLASTPRFRRPRDGTTLTVRELLVLLRDSRMLPVGCQLQPLFVSILPTLYTERLAGVEVESATGMAELEEALAEVMEIDLIYNEFEEAIVAFMQIHQAEGPCPWDPPDLHEGAMVEEEKEPYIPPPQPVVPPAAAKSVKQIVPAEPPAAAKSVKNLTPADNVEVKPEPNEDVAEEEDASTIVEPKTLDSLLAELLLPNIAQSMRREIEGLASAG
ncbi:hypothetical protein AB1Y20_011360 [Prymnesium parvum]|uniref:Uncharacterized protein n=1 Tax=Prymnesium parvum TaxID=97485 RepID=A0AB34IPW9_PRYPA